MTEYSNEKLKRIKYLKKNLIQICKLMILNCIYYILLYVFCIPNLSDTSWLPNQQF